MKIHTIRVSDKILGSELKRPEFNAWRDSEETEKEALTRYEESFLEFEYQQYMKEWLPFDDERGEIMREWDGHRHALKPGDYEIEVQAEKVVEADSGQIFYRLK